MNLGTMLETVAGQYGDKTAISLGEQHYSYNRLDEESNRVANALLGMGISRGDRVALLLPNCPEFVMIYFGVVKAGAVAVPLDVKYKPIELTALFADCMPRVLFTEISLLDMVTRTLPEWGTIKRVVAVGDGDTGTFVGYQEMIAGSQGLQPGVAVEPGDPAHIAYTSGPTLAPRGVVLSHGSLVVEAQIAADGFRQTADDVAVLFALPMHHAFGLVVIMLTSLYRGSRVIMLSGLSIGNLLELMERDKATMFMAVPFVYALIINFAGEERARRDLSSLRVCGSAGAALPVEIMESFKGHYGHDIIDFWGMTESGGDITCQSPDGELKPGSVGRVLPGWEIKIVDDDGRQLPVRQPGEIIARGPVMAGYYNNPQATARALRESWLYTGDTGWLDEDGELFLTGMNKDMIIAKGQNIYPSDIEAVLGTHPGVAEVAVVGVPDEVRGQIVRAVVHLRAGETVTEQELKRFCQKRLANYKVPKQVVFVDTVPRTVDGAVDKDKLRQTGRA